MIIAQPIPRAELAEHLAILQPPAIAGLLLENPKFRAEFGLPIKGAISYGGGPPLSKATLYAYIRRLLSEGQPQSIPALNQQKVRAELGDGDVLISFAAEDGTTVEVGSVVLMLLSPDRETRNTTFECLLADLGPTGPADPLHWRQQLEKGPLDDEAMEQLLNEFDDSIVPHFARVQQDIATGILDKRHLIPTSVPYWEHLCGPKPDRTDQEQWLKELFQSHRRRLIDRELARGLDLCLAMNLRDDLTPRVLTEHISNDDLFTALQQIEPIDDPFSLLGIVDIAAGRATADRRFVDLAVQTVERLCGETFPRQGDGVDVYDFLPALINLAVGELQLIPTIAAQPVFWRHLCAWTQAALMVRAFRTITFDPKVLSEHLQQFRARETSTATLLDLQECPLWHPLQSSKLRLRAEVLGRLKLLRHREENAGREFPGIAALDKATQAFDEYAPLLSDMPGPLETHRFSGIPMPDIDPRQRTELHRRADELTADPAADDLGNWLRFSHLSQIIRFDEYALSRMTKIVPKIDFGSTQESFLSTVTHLISIAYIAVAQRHFPLAEAILARARQEIQKSSDETQTFALVELGLIAVAASADKTAALDHLATYLTDLAYHLPQGAPCRALSQEIQDLKTLTPAGEWKRFSRAEARAALGS